MPTNTFFRLPEAKREKLLAAAEAEFACHSCAEVSINRIIHMAEIPRGSFYQYFEDKMDLFRCVLHRYQDKVDKLILKSLDICGGQLPEFPITLFQQTEKKIQQNDKMSKTFFCITKQNINMDFMQMWDFLPLIHTMIEHTDWSGLTVSDEKDKIALIELLLASCGQSIMATAFGKLTPEESQDRLLRKTALILLGLTR